MIPKNSTPIKNDILINIIGKGLLSLTEIRIIAYIIRWSWGFDGIERRRDFTKKITKREIAKSLGMHESLVNRNINRMIREKKLIVKDGCYQFNEHYEKWKNLTKSQVLNDEKLDKKSNKTCQKVKQSLTNSQTKLDKKSSLGTPNNRKNTIKNKDLRGGEHLFKESIKKYIKESIKKKSDVFKNTWNEYKEMRKKIKKPMTDRAEELILKKLEKITSNEKEQVLILEQSIMNSWQGVYPLKKQKELDDLPLLK